MRLPFAAAYMFRPGVIEPVHGVRSKTPAYRVIYSIVGPLVPLLRRRFPNHVLSTQEIGRAMLFVARQAIRSGSWRPRIFAPSLGLLWNRIARGA
jgi:hypothetical protein